MPALCFLLGALFTWIALYQGILAYAVGPPPDRELVTVSGRVEYVDTPWTRNRFVEATQVKIEVAPVRYVTIAVRQETLPTATLKMLEGKQVIAVIAGLRPRNRWVYDLASEGRQLASLETERARDVAAHSSSIQLMLFNGAIAAILLLAGWRFARHRELSVRTEGAAT